MLKKVIPLQSMLSKLDDKFSMKRLAKPSDLTKENSQNLTTETFHDDRTNSLKN